MNKALLIANVLLFISAVTHLYIGDKDIQKLKNGPPDILQMTADKRLMARCSWHWVSLDLFLATGLLAVLNFTNLLQDKLFILHCLAAYLVGCGIVWFFVVWRSEPFDRKFLQLGQWLFLFITAGLLEYGISLLP